MSQAMSEERKDLPSSKSNIHLSCLTPTVLIQQRVIIREMISPRIHFIHFPRCRMHHCLCHHDWRICKHKLVCPQDNQPQRKITKPFDSKPALPKKSNSLYENIVQSQNMWEGYWDENKFTSSLKEKYLKEYQEIQVLLTKKAIKNESIINRIVFTYLVIHYLYVEHRDKIKEIEMAISKGKTFLINSGLSHSEIISLN